MIIRTLIMENCMMIKEMVVEFSVMGMDRYIMDLGKTIKLMEKV